jgi:hypothetical protein
MNPAGRCLRIGENRDNSENSTGKFTWVTLATQPAYESPESAGVVSIHCSMGGAISWPLLSALFLLVRVVRPEAGLSSLNDARYKVQATMKQPLKGQCHEIGIFCKV